MNIKNEVQILKIKGEKFALLPLEIYERLIEKLEDMQDIAECKEIESQILKGKIELFPSEVVNAVLDGENKIKVFREFRKFTQAELAKRPI
ncbi:MAG: hypothetical protein ACOX3T_07260 [Bdellovibrionota bacterium]